MAININQVIMNKKIYIFTLIMTISLITSTGCNTAPSSETEDKAVTKEEIKTVEPAPTPEPTPEPAPTPTPEPTPAPAPAPAPEPTPAPEPEPAPEPAPAPAESTTTAKCSSLDCLIGLAKTCSKGEFTHEYSMPFFDPENGMTLNVKTYYKINGKDSNNACNLIQQSRGGNAILSEKGRQVLIENGQTEEEINSQMKSVNDSINNPSTLNIITTCTGAGTDISTYLKNSKQGNFSSSCESSSSTEATCSFEPNLTCVTK
jgi:hypothetical protein